MKWNISLPGLAVGLLIVGYEVYKISKEIKRRGSEKSSEKEDGVDE